MFKRIITFITILQFVVSPAYAGSGQAPVLGQQTGTNSAPVVLAAPNQPAAYTFTRPANTTQYAVATAVTDSTNPMSWAIAPGNGIPVYLTSAIVMYQTSGHAGVATTATWFRIHFFGQAPTVITDGVAFQNASVMATWCGYMDVQLDYQGTDWTVGIAHPVGVPALACKPAAGSSTIYGEMEAKATFTPTSAGIFSVQPIAQ